MTGYEAAKAKYAALGVDTDQAIEILKKVPVSLHCWQLDDVIGFDNDGGLTGQPEIIWDVQKRRSSLWQIWKRL